MQNFSVEMFQNIGTILLVYHPVCEDRNQCFHFQMSNYFLYLSSLGSLCGEPEKGKKDIVLIPVCVAICVCGRNTALLTMLLARRLETICR